ncbi:MAG: hypothetical protein RL256_905, partial [Actinomycetota bacterium]
MRTRFETVASLADAKAGLAKRLSQFNPVLQ